MKNTTSLRLRRIGSLLLALLLTLSMSFAKATPARADNKQQELQQAKEEAQNKLNEINAGIKAAQANQAAAAELKQQYAQQETVIKSQSTILYEHITAIKEQISNKETEIQEKQQQIEEKQAEYDERFAGFQERMRAMQRLDNGGAVALLSQATSLYQLLTFSSTLEQISTKDTQMCEELEAQRIELNQQKEALETAKAELEAAQNELEDQNSQLESKRGELVASMQAQNEKISAAEAEEAALEVEAAEARKQLDAAAAALDAYLNEQVRKYGDAAIKCSLNFGPALSTYKYISCVFGAGGHRGTDFAAPANTPIYAVADGIVTTAANHWSYGNYVQIYHGKDDDGNTYSTLYAHMIQWPSVSSGQAVSKGTIIGYVGSTGNSTGNHLHLEMKINGVLTNAANYIPH